MANEINPDSEPPEQEVPETTRYVLEAREFFHAGDHAQAIDACAAALMSKEKVLNIAEAAVICEVLEGCGEGDAAEAIRQQILSSALAAAKENPDSVIANLEAGFFLLEIGSDDESEPYLRRALELEPDDFRPAFMLLGVLLKRGAPEEAIEAWEPYIAATKKPNVALLSLAKGLAHFGFPDHADGVLKRAEELFPNIYQEDKPMAYAAAGIRGKELKGEEQVLAVEMFDKFSSFYDQNLAAIGNSGPRMIGAMLERLPITPQGNLEILDAGCGTGLCVPHLKPYASSLHGCDFSVGMLKASYQKGIYDLLTRTDISVAETLPEGMFDLIVCADVFTYFGDLSVALVNMASKLHPGGWLLFTIEDAGDKELPSGYSLTPSGRYIHREDYLHDVLLASGFEAPADQMKATMRLEFGTPVIGRVVAAQYEKSA